MTGIGAPTVHLSRSSRERSRSFCDAGEGRAACTTLTRLAPLADPRNKSGGRLSPAKSERGVRSSSQPETALECLYWHSIIKRHSRDPDQRDLADRHTNRGKPKRSSVIVAYNHGDDPRGTAEPATPWRTAAAVLNLCNRSLPIVHKRGKRMSPPQRNLWVVGSLIPSFSMGHKRIGRP